MAKKFHRYLPLLLLVVPFILLPLNISSQTINLSLGKIGIGSNKSDVLKKFGRPVSIHRGGIVPCEDGTTKTMLRYTGLVLALESSKQDKEFGVYEIEVTSRKWLVSGIRIGVAKRKVIGRFGKGRPAC